MILRDKQMDFLISCRWGYVRHCVLLSRGKEPYHLSFTPSSVVETPCLFPVCHLSCCLCSFILARFIFLHFFIYFSFFFHYFIFLPNPLSSNELPWRMSLLRMTLVLNSSSDSFKLSAKHKRTRKKRHYTITHMTRKGVMFLHISIIKYGLRL